MQTINGNEILKNLQSISYSDILNSKITIIVVSILILVTLLKLAHVLVKNFTKRIISSTDNSERIKEVTTISHVVKSALDTIIILVFLMIVLTKLGVDIRPILTAAGVLGVAVGFGAKRFIEDIITGLIILIEGQIRVGDVVQIGDKTGTVEKVDLKMVVLRDLHGRVHYIRNGMIDIVTNLTRDFSYYVLELGISYKENIDRVTNILKEIFAKELMTNSEMSEKIIGEIEVLGLDSFADSSVVIKLRIKTRPMQQWVVGREFNRLIKNKFDELNIEIPFPQTTMHIVKTDEHKEL